MAEAHLRSSVDVGFAEVRVAEAGVLLTRAENEQQASMLTLANAMGLDQPGDWTLADPAAADAPIEMEVAIKEATEARPEVEAMRHRVRAARLQAESDRKLRMPAISGLLAGGAIPAGDQRLRPQYAGAAVNINVPLWNSGLFSARLQESAARAEAIDRDLRELELRVRSQVRLAHLELETSRRNLAATRIFSEQAARTLRLAESRYQLGLGAIIEFTQAQVDAASAELARAAATYDVAIRRARLEYEMGRLAARP
jgi:outer membrane protein